MTRFALLMIVLSVAVTFAVGCSGITKIFEKHDVALELVVRATAGRILTENPAWVAPAQLITAEALALIDDDPLVSLAELEQTVVARINWNKLTPEEQALLRVLISGVRQDLEEHFRQKGISDPSGAAVRAAQILNWINQSATLRMSSSGINWSSLQTYARGTRVMPWAGGCGA